MKDLTLPKPRCLLILSCSAMISRAISRVLGEILLDLAMLVGGVRRTWEAGGVRLERDWFEGRAHPFGKFMLSLRLLWGMDVGGVSKLMSVVRLLAEMALCSGLMCQESALDLTATGVLGLMFCRRTGLLEFDRCWRTPTTWGSVGESSVQNVGMKIASSKSKFLYNSEHLLTEPKESP